MMIKTRGYYKKGSGYKEPVDQQKAKRKRTLIISVNPSVCVCVGGGGADSATAHWQSGYSDSVLPQLGMKLPFLKTKGIYSNLTSVSNDGVTQLLGDSGP